MDEKPVCLHSVRRTVSHRFRQGLTNKILNICSVSLKRVNSFPHYQDVVRQCVPLVSNGIHFTELLYTHFIYWIVCLGIDRDMIICDVNSFADIDLILVIDIAKVILARIIAP